MKNGWMAFVRMGIANRSHPSPGVASASPSMSCPYETHDGAGLRRFLFTVIFFSFISNTLAIPSNVQVRPRDDASTNISPKVWTALTVMLVVFFILFACGCSKRIITRCFGRYASGGNAADSRELTAEQLAGAINRNANSTNDATNTAGGRPRRTRRPRRTPSQISTTSLPAYMKDPGEHELVIFRGPTDMQDIPQPLARVMSPVDEDGDGEEASPRTRGDSYDPLPNSSAYMPLLEEDNGASRQSVNSDYPDSLSRMDANQYSLDARGDAPTYDEAIRILPMQSAPLEEVDLTDPSAAPTSPMLPQRILGLRTFLNSMNPSRNASQSVPPNDLRMSHHRTDSHTSDVSSSASLSTSQSHRPSPTASGSFFRVLSRQRSMRSTDSSALNSPSVISISSISAPLSHTLVRTDITFPKAGPTPEQIRAITSRDALGRFAVPYGADAIAYAASTSLQDLSPPPDFDSITSTTNLLSRIDTGLSESSVIPSPPLDTVTAPASTRPTDTFVRTELDTIPQTPVDEPSSLNPAQVAVIPSLTVSQYSPLLSIQSLHAPPSEFVSTRRTESRMSSHSMQSYVTAEESLSTPATAYQDAFSTPMTGSPPETPKMGGQHGLEQSNASTIKS